MKLSARNRIPAKVVGVSQGEAIANVVLDAKGQRIVASITVEAVRDLGIAEEAKKSSRWSRLRT